MREAAEAAELDAKQQYTQAMVDSAEKMGHHENAEYMRSRLCAKPADGGQRDGYGKAETTYPMPHPVVRPDSFGKAGNTAANVPSGLEAAFARAMQGKCYGREETADAKAWFRNGYIAAGLAVVIDDAMVERACESFYGADWMCDGDEGHNRTVNDQSRASLRAALTAALSGREGSNG